MLLSLQLVTLAVLTLLIRQVSAGSDPSTGAAPSSTGAAAPSSGGSNLEAYQAALNTISDNINKATEKSEALISKHMAAVDKDPGALITKEAMQKMMQGSAFLPQRAGTRSVMVESQQGFNGISSYQPSGWKITETMSGPTEKKPEPASVKGPVFMYPMGLGPVLMNGCTAAEYPKTSPCYNSKRSDLEKTICKKMMDAANYMGVGFDGRGYYRTESRRASLVQRTCANRRTFLGQDVPDTMNVYGIFETRAETKSFQTADEYMSYIRSKAGLSEQKNLFISEASKFSKAKAFGANLGGIGSIIGGAIGAVAGGPVAAGMGAAVGGAIGGSLSIGSGTGSGSESATDKGQASSSVFQNEALARQQSAGQSFFAIMYVNVILYEISLDDVKPTDITLAALRDYMSLPVSYYSAGADVKYQNFLLRWGTHFIRSAKFGGQLTITKTAKSDKIKSEQEFASIAQTEFQAMFNTLTSKWSQESSSWGFLGLGGQDKSTSQSSSAASSSGYTGKLNQDYKQSQAFRQSEFTQTTVEAQGGTPEIAEALVDFYTPAFKQLFHDWIVSIKDYVKPFEFQLRPINELFNLNMDNLFPAGSVDYGCAGDGSSAKAQILVDPVTNVRYYMDTKTFTYDNVTETRQVRVNCKYSSLADFKQDIERRRLSLEKAIGVYMAEGPFPTSSFELKGGQAGCEEDTMAQFELFHNASAPLTFAELTKEPFIIAFNLPESVPDMMTPQAKYTMVYRFDRWFAVEPETHLVNLYDGCQVVNLKPTDTKICFRNIILTYEEVSGFFRVDAADFAASKLRIPSLPYWLSGTTVARSKKLIIPTASLEFLQKQKRVAIPCNVKWLNSHRLDPAKTVNCIHFTAATEGDLFVVFSSIPRDHTTWYYLQISTEGVSFYSSVALQKNDQKKGLGLLGDANLFQSFFVCVNQTQSGAVTMQYGKADPDSDVGTVYSSHSYPPDSQLSRLSFYTFGTGTKPASLMDIRLTQKLPEVTCASSDYVKVDGQCLLACHPECNGCIQARDSKACQQCKSMRVETGSGGNKVTECTDQCPAGLYPSSSQPTLCIPCTAGTYKATAGNQKCSPCEKGTASTEGATGCAGCPAGTYSDNAGSQRCEKCPAGKYSAAGVTSCTVCAPGSFSEAGQAECNPCPYGQYGNLPGMAQCSQCSAGFFADKRGMTACSSCPAGSSSSPGSRTCENNCQVGEFSPSIGQACEKCPAGSYAESRGSVRCSQCTVGFYQSMSGQSKCVAALIGSYVSQTGANTVVTCPAGTFNDQEGQSTSAACKPCQTGTYSSSVGSASCAKCPVGQYQSNIGQTGCVQTSAGYYTNVEGSSSQTACPAGRVAPNPGATACTVCQAGQFASAGSATCGSCTEFQYSQPGSESCANCPYSGLAKSDRVSCYTKAQFKSCYGINEHSAYYSCQRAMDNSREVPTFVGSIWYGYLTTPVPVRKIVLWKRTDCCPDQFKDITVYVKTSITDPAIITCGTVTPTDKPYFVMDCNAENIGFLLVGKQSTATSSFAEVEVYY